MDEYFEIFLIFFCGSWVTISGGLLIYIYIRDVIINPLSWADLSITKKLIHTIMMTIFTWIFFNVGTTLCAGAMDKLHRKLNPQYDQEEFITPRPDHPFPTPKTAIESAGDNQPPKPKTSHLVY